MYIMHISEFLRLAELEPHQSLRDAGKLVKWAPHMKHVIFLSHQWTSFHHPDPSSEQLRVVQRVLLRMMAGDVPVTTPAFADAVYLPKGASISPKEWARIVPDAYIWMECAASSSVRPCLQRHHVQRFRRLRLLLHRQLLLGASNRPVL